MTLNRKLERLLHIGELRINTARDGSGLGYLVSLELRNGGRFNAVADTIEAALDIVAYDVVNARVK